MKRAVVLGSLMSVAVLSATLAAVQQRQTGAGAKPVPFGQETPSADALMVEKVKARFTIFLRQSEIGGKIYQPNDLVKDDDKVLKPYEEDGSIDASAAAVSYCEREFAEQHKARAKAEKAEGQKG